MEVVTKIHWIVFLSLITNLMTLLFVFGILLEVAGG